MAVERGGEFLDELDPPAADRPAFDGEFWGSPCPDAAEDGRTREQPTAQRHLFALAELAEPALPQHAKVFGGDG